MYHMTASPRQHRVSEETLEKRETFKEWLCGRLAIVRWSRAELARRTGIHKDTISGYIHGVTTVSAYNEKKIQEAFEMVGL